jgi:hypothetical protein
MQLRMSARQQDSILQQLAVLALGIYALHPCILSAGVFDTCLITDGHAYQLDRHLARFKASAEAAGLVFPRSDAAIMRIILDTAAASRKLNGARSVCDAHAAGSVRCTAAHVQLLVSTVIGYPAAAGCLCHCWGLRQPMAHMTTLTVVPLSCTPSLRHCQVLVDRWERRVWAVS